LLDGVDIDVRALAVFAVRLQPRASLLLLASCVSEAPTYAGPIGTGRYSFAVAPETNTCTDIPGLPTTGDQLEIAFAEDGDGSGYGSITGAAAFDSVRFYCGDDSLEGGGIHCHETCIYGHCEYDDTCGGYRAHLNFGGGLLQDGTFAGQLAVTSYCWGLGCAETTDARCLWYSPFRATRL
jgi:hypothetical protein